MFRRLQSVKRSCDTFISRGMWICDLNTHRIIHSNSKTLNLQSSIILLHKKHFWSVTSIRSLEPVLHVSNCTWNDSLSKHYADKVNTFSTKFVQFHDDLVSQDSDSTMSFSEWETLEREILTESPHLAPGLDYSIMKSLKGKPDLSVSFLRYIRSKREANLSVLAEFFINCAEKYEDIVVDEFEKLMKGDRNGVYLKRIRIAQGIGLTREWRHCIDLLEINVPSGNIRLPATVMSALSGTLKQALKEKDYEALFQVWKKFSQGKSVNDDNEIVSNVFYESWKEGLMPFDVFMELLKLDELPLQEAAFRDVQQYWHREHDGRATAKVSSANKESRQCRCCKELLPEQELVEESVFEQMAKEIFDKMLIGDNIFKKTNPKELEKFSTFMVNQKYPFDYVIDGLNFIYKTSGGEDFQLLLSTLENLSEKGHRVLLILKGKVKLPPKFKQLATVFTLQHKTYDDCYMMLAAFLSGPRCYVVTNDDCRDHMAIVDPSLRPHFLKWRDQNRIFHGSSHLYYPAKYKWTAHESARGWHIPCRKSLNVNNTLSGNHYVLTDFKTRTFLCVEKLDYTPSPELIQLKKAAQYCFDAKLDEELINE